MEKGFPKLNIKLQVEGMLKILPERNQVILRRRFALGSGQPETLESIGRGYKITRERVRQIESVSCLKLINSSHLQKLAPFVEQISLYIQDKGGAVKETELLEDLVTPVQCPYLRFLLSLSDKFVRSAEDDTCHPMWGTDKKALENVRAVLRDAETVLDKKGTAVDFGELGTVGNYISISKNIARGVLGDWGLKKWPEISPRGVRDKAYLCMRSSDQPMHFRDVARAIDGANAQTVHNELIKDDRFVLVGHGLYALRERGYEPGAVREVLQRLLKRARRPLPARDLIKQVLQQRHVQENTIALNLQNRKYFRRGKGGKYYLA